VEINPQDSQPIDKMPGDALSDDNTVTLYVRDTRGKNQRLRVPLIEAADFGVDSKNSSSSLPSGVLQQLRDGGFDVKRRRRFAPMFFEQNERVVPMVIPVDDMYIVPVSRPVY
jgi:hypothetical protein